MSLVPKMRRKGVDREMLNKQLFKSAYVKKGYTQQSLAEAMGMSANTMSSRETGKSSFDTQEIDKLCKLLDITKNSEKAEIFLAEPSQ